MRKELRQFYIHGRRKIIMYDALASGVFSAIFTDTLCSVLKIPHDTIELMMIGLVVSFVCGLIICKVREDKIYAERTYTPPRQKYLGEMFLDEYTDEQLFKDIEADKELQEAIERNKKAKKKKK